MSKSLSNLPFFELNNNSVMKFDLIYIKYDYFEPNPHYSSFDLKSSGLHKHVKDGMTIENTLYNRKVKIYD